MLAGIDEDITNAVLFSMLFGFEVACISISESNRKVMMHGDINKDLENHLI